MIVDVVDELIDFFEEAINDESYAVDQCVISPQPYYDEPFLLGTKTYYRDHLYEFNTFLANNGIDIVSNMHTYNRDVAKVLGPIEGKVTLKKLRFVDCKIDISDGAECVIDFKHIYRFNHFKVYIDRLLMSEGTNLSVMRYMQDEPGLIRCKGIDLDAFMQLCLLSYAHNNTVAVGSNVARKFREFLEKLVMFKNVIVFEP